MTATTTKERKTRRRRRVVVGVDGSAGSKRALRWALEEAKLRGALLVAVHAWHFPSVESPYWMVPIEGAELEEAASKILDGAIREVMPKGGSQPKVERRVRQGSPVQALVEEARGAELAVVGSRGLGGFSGLMLGSVSAQLAHHAPCPVVIVPAPAESSSSSSEK